MEPHSDARTSYYFLVLQGKKNPHYQLLALPSEAVTTTLGRGACLF